MRLFLVADNTNYAAPGVAWQPGNGHTIETRYLVNTVTLPVQRWVRSGTDFVSPGL